MQNFPDSLPVLFVIFPLNHPIVMNMAVQGVSLAGCPLIRQFIFNMSQKDVLTEQ